MVVDDLGRGPPHSLDVARISARRPFSSNWLTTLLRPTAARSARSSDSVDGLIEEGDPQLIRVEARRRPLLGAVGDLVGPVPASREPHRLLARRRASSIGTSLSAVTTAKPSATRWSKMRVRGSDEIHDHHVRRVVAHVAKWLQEAEATGSRGAAVSRGSGDRDLTRVHNHRCVLLGGEHVGALEVRVVGELAEPMPTVTRSSRMRGTPPIRFASTVMRSNAMRHCYAPSRRAPAVRAPQRPRV